MTSIRAERALRDPSSVFDSPEAVLQDKELGMEEKRAILERWRQNTGSPIGGGGEPNLVARLARALSFLDEETGAHEVSHDQGFYTSVSDIGREDRNERK
ncbi:hypothetical protein [Benzoatithermus flavus]|uniref:Uncharacterized protein n=1 Tax=Benzoatithermus flavus TaxID=3108223 RepID=A0ABU8XZ09_9PROT